MVAVRNKAPGPRGAWQGATLIMAEPGQVIEADDFEPEWFEEVESEGEPEGKPEAEPAPHPLDHDGDGKPGGSPAGENATRRRGRAPQD